MKNIKYFINLMIAILILTACDLDKLDNYEAPNGGIYGQLTDKITGKNFQTEQPNGFTIKLFEKGGLIQSPITFFGKPDGSFENAWIFQNEYKVLITEGAFFPVDTVTVQVGKRTEVNFDVMPFLAIVNITVTPSKGKVTVNYKITRNQVGDKIIISKTLISKIPTVNNAVFDFVKENDLATMEDDEILTTTFTDEISNLTSGKTYYVRIATRTKNSLNKYNYSEIFTVTIP